MVWCSEVTPLCPRIDGFFLPIYAVFGQEICGRLTLGGSDAYRSILPCKNTEVRRLPTEQQTIAEFQPKCSGGWPIIAGGRILVAYASGYYLESMVTWGVAKIL